MEIALIILAVVVFAINYSITLRYGSDSPLWLILILVAVFGGGFIVTKDASIGSFSILPIFAFVSSRIIALITLRNRAGKRLLTYARSKSGIFWSLIFATLPFYLVYQWGSIVMDGLRNNILLGNEGLTKLQMLNLILFAIVGVSNLANVFRKGEFFELGISDPDFQFYPWSGFNAYEWVEYKRKNEKRFLLYLEGKQNVSQSIDNLSLQDKNIVEELLSTKLKKLPDTTNHRE